MTVPRGAAYIIEPVMLTDAMITSSTVSGAAADEVAWSATEINSVGDQRYIDAPTATVTISYASPAVVTWTGHNLGVGSPVVFTTSGTLPSGITAGQVYYVGQVLGANTFTLTNKLVGGLPVSTGSIGSGTHTGTAPIHGIYQALIGARATVTVTIATPAVVTWTGHGLTADTPIVFTTTGALPTGITAGTTYYVIAGALAANTFQFSASLGGTAVNTSGTQSGVHTAGLAANYNKPPLANLDTVWARARPTNAYALFDRSTGTVTRATSPFTVVLRPGQNGGLFLDELVGADLAITVKDVPGGTVIDTRAITLDDTPCTSVYDWFFEPYVQRTTVTLTDLPSQYFDPEITVTVTASSPIECGWLMVGPVHYIGGTLEGASLGRIDYSKNQTDFGVTTLEEGAVDNLLECQVLTDAAEFNRIARLLKRLRATLAVYVPTAREDLSAMTTVGIPQDWSIAVPHTYAITANLQIQGMNQ